MGAADDRAEPVPAREQFSVTPGALGTLNGSVNERATAASAVVLPVGGGITMTDRSRNDARSEVGDPQGGLLMREEQAAQTTGPGTTAAGGADHEATALPPLNRSLWARIGERMHRIFGSKEQFVDDLLECAPVGTYVAMAEQTLAEEARAAEAADRTPANGIENSRRAPGSVDHAPQGERRLTGSC